MIGEREGTGWGINGQTKFGLGWKESRNVKGIKGRESSCADPGFFFNGGHENLVLS